MATDPRDKSTVDQRAQVAGMRAQVGALTRQRNEQADLVASLSASLAGTDEIAKYWKENCKKLLRFDVTKEFEQEMRVELGIAAEKAPAPE